MKQKLHLVGYLLTRYFKDARYHERKIHYAVATGGLITSAKYTMQLPLAGLIN